MHVRNMSMKSFLVFIMFLNFSCRMPISHVDNCFWIYTPFQLPNHPATCQELVVDGELAAPVNKLLDQAKSALEKLTKEAVKLLKSPEKLTADQAKQMRQMYATAAAQKDISNVDHVRMFAELPSGQELTKQAFDAHVYQVAGNVDKFNQHIEACNGTIRAKSN